MKITETVTHDADPLRTFQMVTDHDYQVARCRRTGSSDQTVTVDRDADGSTTVTTQRHLPSAGLPDIARTFLGETLLIVETVRWGGADPDGEREGAMSLELPGVPVTFTGGVHLRRGSAPGTTSHVVDGDLEAAIPFLGKRVEAMVADQIGTMVQVEQEVSRAWLAEHPGTS